MSSRKRTPDQESTETTAAVAEPTPAVAGAGSAEVKPEGQSFAERVGQKKWVSPADPFGIAKDNLAGVRLFESRQDRQMAIKFDEKPPQPVIDRMREAQWTWKPKDGIWAYPVNSESAMRTRIEAERLYQEVRQMIRHEKGIEAGQDIPF